MADKLKQRATVPELGQILERSERVVREIIHSLGLKRDTQSRYLVAPIVEEHVERQKRDGRTVAAMNAKLDEPITWADKLKAKQVEKLDVQIQALRCELIPIDDHRSALSEHAEIAKGALRNFCQSVAAKIRDVEAVKTAEHLTASAIREMRESITNAKP